MFKDQLAKEVAARRTFAIISHPNIWYHFKPIQPISIIIMKSL